MTTAKKTRSKRRTTAEEIAELRQTVQRLLDHVALLTMAVDELTAQVQRDKREVRNEQPAALPKLTSMPLDPATKDWQINRACAVDLPAHLQTPTRALSQRELFR